MQPLKNELPRSDDVLFVFYDFETTQDKKVLGERDEERSDSCVCSAFF
jgi:hypothetical protein